MSRICSIYKLNNQIILPEYPEENYQPTDEEIIEYAIYIGIDPEKVFSLFSALIFKENSTKFRKKIFFG